MESNQSSPGQFRRVVGQLRELLSKGTPGPWETYQAETLNTRVYSMNPTSRNVTVCRHPCASIQAKADAQLIATMHSAFPALLAIAEAAQEVQDGIDKRDEDESEWAAAGQRVSAMEMHDRRMRLARALAALPNPKVELAPASGAQFQRVDGQTELRKTFPEYLKGG